MNFFSSSVGRSELDRIQAQTGFALGELPIRYLGVPIVTRSLAAKDCKILIEKITARVKHWTSKFLS